MEACTSWGFSGSIIGRRACLRSLLIGSFATLRVGEDKALASLPSGDVSVQLHMYIQVKPGQGGEFETRYRTAYLPIVRRQKGFRSSSLLRKRDLQDQYEIDLAFDSEALRAAWASSPDHDRAWKPLGEVIGQITVQGFDVIG